MKRRHRVRRCTWSRQQPLQIFTRRQPRKRKSFTFERLEDRFAFSASPVDAGVAGISSDTLEGAAALWQRELEWAAMQAVQAAGIDPQYTFLALPSDPMFPNQWHLWNVGQEVGNPDLQHLFGTPGVDINVLPVWQGSGLERPYTGAGVQVVVFDSGVQFVHPDLAANVHPTFHFNATDGTTNASPFIFDPSNYHGTAVAAIIGAVANNAEGGSGIAPGVTIIPIRRDFSSSLEETRAFQWVNKFDFDITNNSWGPVHQFSRFTQALTSTELEILRNSVMFGRDGLGIIHVFASGNNGGPAFGTPGFPSIGNYDSSSYNPWVNSRYTIGVTGVDHDGLYANADGTFTSYPVAGPSVLVAAPTGSNAFLSLGDDTGFGSGIWTADLLDDFGNNAAPDPSTGFDFDQDRWPDPDYTSRFNGTSAAAPMVTGVIALMLEANPNLTYRDVQEILVRSAKQNAQFEFPSSGGIAGQVNDLPPKNTWQINQIGPFRNPDSFFDPNYAGAGQATQNPLADANKFDSLSQPFPQWIFTENFPLFLNKFAPHTNDFSRQFLSHYEPQPAFYTNGAGYTVSQGYGVYGEQIGYGHGMIDAALAVEMAEKWHSPEIAQNINPRTEKTWSTGPVGPGQGFSWSILSGSQINPPPNGNSMVVPGGFDLPDTPHDTGYIAYWNEYFADMPFNNYTGPHGSERGMSYVDFAVPPPESVDVEWVEVKLDIGGPVDDLDFLRIFLTSPDGTQSELNNYYLDPNFAGQYSLQLGAEPVRPNNPLGDIANIDTGGFVWTFSTNRHWGESSNSTVIIDPVSGEPVLVDVWRDPLAPPTGEKLPVFRNWELHIENWSNSAFSVQGIELIWHGKPIAGGQLDTRAADPNVANRGAFEDYSANGIARAQRVQGFVGIDSNSDNNFNFSRYVQTVEDPDFNQNTMRVTDVTRQLDFTDVNGNGIYDPAFDIINQEPFAANVLVEAFVVNNPGTVNEFVDTIPVDQFLTGADGNYYFDLDPTKTYEIRVRDLNAVPGVAIEDTFTPGTAPVGFQYMPHYRETWRITPDWFFAPDRDNPLIVGNNPGEILFGSYDANGDGTATLAPKPFTNTSAAFGPIRPTAATPTLQDFLQSVPPQVANEYANYVNPIPMAVKNINFLLKREAPSNQIVVDGTVYVDLDANGTLTPNLDTPAQNVRVYYDVNGNGQYDQGSEPFEITGPEQHAVFHIDFDTTTAAGVTVTAVDGEVAEGRDGNGIRVMLIEDASVVGGVSSVAFDDLTNILRVRANFASGTVTNTEVAAAIEAHAAFDAEATGPAGTNLVAGDVGTYFPTYTTPGRDVGMYSFTVSATTATQVRVGVDPTFGPTAWVPTVAGGLSQSVIATPGDLPSVIDFFVLPPPPDPTAGQLGNILGFVFIDLDEDGVKDPGELGVEGLLIFADVNEDGVWNNDGDEFLEPGEEVGTQTTANGSFFLSNVPSGSVRVVLETAGSTYVPTVPSSGIRQVVLGTGQTKTGTLFGVKNLADRDWGDLPASYSTTSTDAFVGPSHKVYSHFRLGSSINGEVDGQPSPPANLDMHDDGVILVGGVLQPGDNILRVTVSGVGGALTGWIDWDKDGKFEAVENVPGNPSAKITWRTTSGTLLGNEADLNPGTYDLVITSPGVNGPVAARFRWGEQGLDYFGPASIGEVEDYFFASTAVAIFAGDYNDDGKVDMADFVVWRKFRGTATLLPNDITPGTVDQSDYMIWVNNFGAIEGAGAGAGGGQALAAGSESEETSDSSPEAVASSPLASQPAATVEEPALTTSSTIVVSAPALVASESSTAIDTTSFVSVPSAVTDTQPALSAPSLAIDLAVIGETSKSFASTAGGSLVPGEAGGAAGEGSDTDLLLDSILADLVADDEEAPLVDRFNHDEEGVGELELAAVFEDESNWWGV